MASLCSLSTAGPLVDSTCRVGERSPNSGRSDSFSTRSSRQKSSLSPFSGPSNARRFYVPCAVSSLALVRPVVSWSCDQRCADCAKTYIEPRRCACSGSRRGRPVAADCRFWSTDGRRGHHHCHCCCCPGWRNGISSARLPCHSWSRRETRRHQYAWRETRRREGRFDNCWRGSEGHGTKIRDL